MFLTLYSQLLDVLNVISIDHTQLQYITEAFIVYNSVRTFKTYISPKLRTKILYVYDNSIGTKHELHGFKLTISSI